MREIANRVDRNIATVVIRRGSRWSEEGLHERRRGSGSARTTTAREECQLRTLALRYSFSTTRAVGNHWLETLQRRLSVTE